MENKVSIETDLLLCLMDKSARLDAIERYLTGKEYTSTKDIKLIGGFEIDEQEES